MRTFDLRFILEIPDQLAHQEIKDLSARILDLCSGNQYKLTLIEIEQINENDKTSRE